MSTNFNFTYGVDVTLQQMIGVEMAGKIWSSYLQDNVTLNIHVGTSSNLPENVIGGALPGIKADIDAGSVYAALKDDRTTNNDYLAFSNLGGVFDLSKGTAFSDSGSGNNFPNISDLNLTRANAKALNLVDNTSSSLDGVILLADLGDSNLSWNYDYSREQAMAEQELDYLSTILHEIGHVVGFISGVDQPGWLAKRDIGEVAAAGTDSTSEPIGTAEHTTSLDLYRYSNQNGSPAIDLSYGSITGDKYFSIDGGITELAGFSTGVYEEFGGDGAQASHWKQGTAALMSPSLQLQERLDVSGLDLTAFDVIGWDTEHVMINYASLHEQAQIDLATMFTSGLSDGEKLDWMSQTLSNETLAKQFSNTLTDDQSAAIQEMIENSQIYHWGGDGDGWWQKVAGNADSSSSNPASPLPNPSNFAFSIEFGTSGSPDNAYDTAQPVIAPSPQNSSEGLLEDTSISGVTEVTFNNLEIIQSTTTQFELSTPISFDWDSFDGLESLQSASKSKLDLPEWGAIGDGTW